MIRIDKWNDEVMWAGAFVSFSFSFFLFFFSRSNNFIFDPNANRKKCVIYVSQSYNYSYSFAMYRAHFSSFSLVYEQQKFQFKPFSFARSQLKHQRRIEN